MAVVFESASTTNFTSGTSITITKPSGLAVGDLMIGFIGGSSNTSANYTFPGGWTVIDGSTTGGESWRSGYKVADSGDVAASNFTMGSTDGEFIGGSIVRISGAVADFTVKSKQTVNASGTFTTADLTPSSPNSLLLFYVMVLGSADPSSGYACVTSNPTWTEAYDFGSTAPATDYAMVMAYANRPETTSTGDFSFTQPSGSDNMGFFVSLSPFIDVNVSVDAPGILTLSQGGSHDFILDNTFVLDTAGILTLNSGEVNIINQENTVWTEETKNSSTVWVEDNK